MYAIYISPSSSGKGGGGGGGVDVVVVYCVALFDFQVASSFLGTCHRWCFCGVADTIP